jgi:opacity protein-like surface antigen
MSAQELGFTLGNVFSTARSGGNTKLDLGRGTALEFDYGQRLWKNDTFAVLLNVHFLANPQRVVSSLDRTLTRDVATIYAVPGVKIQFRPDSRLRPFVTAGVGYALYEQSLTRIDLVPNPAARLSHKAAFGYGGGADVGVLKWLALRGEYRGYVTGSPAFNTTAISGAQHNPVLSGGFVLTFGR